MKTQNQHSEGLSVYAISRFIKRDRGTVQRACDSIAPIPGTKLYRLADVEAAITSVKVGKSLRDDKITEEIRKLKLKNDMVEGRLVDDSRVCQAMLVILQRGTKVLWQKLVNELPVAVARPGEEGDARAYCKRLYNSVATEWRTMLTDPALRALLESHESSLEVVQ